MFCFSPKDPPGAPSCPEVTDKTKNTIKLAWKSPEKDGHSPIQGYIVEMQEEGSPDWKRASEPDKLIPKCEYEVPNLQTLKKYRFRIKAVNAVGESEPSLSTSEIIMKETLGKHF